MARFEIVIADKGSSGTRRIVLGKFGAMLATVLMALVAVAVVVLAVVLGYVIAGALIAIVLVAIMLSLIRGIVRSLRR